MKKEIHWRTVNYIEQLTKLPEKGQHIIGQQTDDMIVVYQAFNHKIADYAIAYQHFGGNHYSYQRMSWIKPNFLWMMYRCGWAEKQNQERVLAIWINKTDFDTILENAVFSAFKPEYYNNHEAWKTALAQKAVRLQWDPDHDPYGTKMTRRAIQLGMKGNILKAFGTTQIQQIKDITPFVKAQKQLIREKQISELRVPEETIYLPSDVTLCRRIGISVL